MREFGNTFGIIRPLRPAQTQINLRIRMSVDDVTFMQTIYMVEKCLRVQHYDSE